MAAITSIDLERRVLAVEWYEGGETKGKEIDCDLIMQLNPELRKPLSSRSVNSRSTNKERSASASSKRKDDRRTICTPAKVLPCTHITSLLHSFLPCMLAVLHS